MAGISLWDSATPCFLTGMYHAEIDNNGPASEEQILAVINGLGDYSGCRG